MESNQIKQLSRATVLANRENEGQVLLTQEVHMINQDGFSNWDWDVENKELEAVKQEWYAMQEWITTGMNAGWLTISRSIIDDEPEYRVTITTEGRI